MLVKASNLPRLLTYLNTTNDKNEFENTVWFAIVPDVELNQSSGGKLQRVRFAGNQRQEKGKNFVGRGDDMDIQILGDNEIDRKNHTIIVYDDKKLNTMILPGDSSGLAYLNDEPVYVPTELKAYDIISMGKSRFVFVALCGTNFSWDDVK